MKNILILVVLVVALSGCASADEPVTTVVPDQKTNNQYEELANNLQDNTMPESDKILDPANQPNLLANYSSAVIMTNMGDITVEFFNDDAPVTVNNFLYLAQQGFYEGTIFHRVIKDFMIQGGDPLSKSADKSRHGTGGPDYRFKDEFNTHKLVSGSLAMANSGPGTNGSQFFIVTAESTPWLDGRHTNFGQVISGMNIVEQIEGVSTGVNDHPIDDIIIEKIILK